jgi:hypothetical protein
MYLKNIAAGAAFAGVLGFTAVGLGAGVASAAPSAPVVAGWQLDGHGGHWGHGGDGGDWGDRGGWDNGGDWGGGGNWGYGPAWNPCVTGPFGFVTVCA